MACSTAILATGADGMHTPRSVISKAETCELKDFLDTIRRGTDRGARVAAGLTQVSLSNLLKLSAQTLAMIAVSKPTRPPSAMSSND